MALYGRLMREQPEGGGSEGNAMEGLLPSSSTLDSLFRGGASSLFGVDDGASSNSEGGTQCYM